MTISRFDACHLSQPVRALHTTALIVENTALWAGIPLHAICLWTPKYEIMGLVRRKSPLGCGNIPIFWRNESETGFDHTGRPASQSHRQTLQTCIVSSGGIGTLFEEMYTAKLKFVQILQCIDFCEKYRIAFPL